VSTGIITLIAGSGGTGIYSGDNGAATSAVLNEPTGVAVDSAGQYPCCLIFTHVELTFHVTYRQCVHS